MRRQISAVALAAAALLMVVGIGTGSAQASVLTVDPVPPVPSGPSVDSPGTDAAAIDAAQATVGDRELGLIRGQADSSDMMGFKPSLYLGKWFMPGKEDVRRCIIDRESHSNYRANNGSYFGAYQMSRDLAVGATWMMQKEIRDEFGAEGVNIVQVLRKQTPDKWNRYWQDRAFWTIWRNGEGADHWGGARCS